MKPKLYLLSGIAGLSILTAVAIAITGGTVDTNNTYSNVGAVVVAPPDIEPWEYASGTLIHPRVFLSAGHVTEVLLQHRSDWSNIYIGFGKDGVDPLRWHEIETVITHPDYYHDASNGMSNNPHYNDVGVVILKEPIYDLPLANLPYEGLLDDLKAAGQLRTPGQGGERFTVVGYGSSLDWPPPRSVNDSTMRRYALSSYLSLTPSWLYTQQNPATGNGGGGYGDSGGPNFWVAPDGTRYLVAITSRGDPELVATNISWRVDIPETLDFIDSVLAGLP